MVVMLANLGQQHHINQRKDEETGHHKECDACLCRHSRCTHFDEFQQLQCEHTGESWGEGGSKRISWQIQLINSLW